MRISLLPHHSFLRAALTSSTLLALALGTLTAGENQLVARAVLPAATFAPGPTSGQYLGATPINGQTLPFVAKQPVQGFSALLREPGGRYLAMSDNGFGSLENSADYHLRVYRIRPLFRTFLGGPGTIQVNGFFELKDPGHHIPFAITNHFSEERILTGADFDIESMQRAPDGTLWFGDEFGPFLLHTSAEGTLLEAPIPLPDLAQAGRFIRAPQNPFQEESSAVRIMNAVRAHAQANGNSRTPVFSPYHVMLVDGNPSVDHYARGPASPAGSGLAPAASDIFNAASLQSAGFPVVAWTVNNPARMTELMRHKLNGIISDRPDLLFQAVAAFDANNDGTAGDLLTPDGLIDITRFDAQGHRGGRDLRPENTLPAMEVALDHLMTTLELDCGVTRNGIPVLSHDPHIMAQKARRADGTPYAFADEVLISDLTLRQIQQGFIADNLFRGPDQSNDRTLSPVAVAFAADEDLIDPYVMPSLQQVFDFVEAYVTYYKTGAGSSHPDAAKRWLNAAQVRFNIETKVNPRSDRDNHGQVYSERTIAAEPFARRVARVIARNDLEERADIQSFDFRTLLEVQERYPAIRTVYLFGDFPIYADQTNSDSDDSTNLQDEQGANTPWLAGLFWPYRVTRLDHPFKAQSSGGFEGMALSADGRKLLPLLEKPLIGGGGDLLIHEFSLASRSYTGVQYRYPLAPRGVAIGDFIMFDHEQGLVIERDNTQGDLAGFKAIFRITLGPAGSVVEKEPAVDLMHLADPWRISRHGARPGDIGLGRDFAFPFVTIEDVVVLDRWHLGVINDNNFPFSLGRHLGTGRPDDTEFIIIRLAEPLHPAPRCPDGNG